MPSTALKCMAELPEIGDHWGMKIDVTGLHHHNEFLN
jgi:hypothetical protein